MFILLLGGISLENEDLLTEIPADDINEEYEIPSKTYSIDFENGRILGKIDDIEAVKQAIGKAIITPRFKCLIYDDEYGSEIKEDVISKDSSEAYLQTVIPDYITDALLPDERIIDVGDFDITIKEDSAYIHFTAHTVFGDIEIEEVV